MEPRELGQLATPVPVVDLDRLDANISRVADYAAAHRLALRPHVKTHKSAHVAALQIGAGASGVTCATPREAEEMRAATDDILVAYPMIGTGRADRVARLAANARISVMLDSVESVDAFVQALEHVNAHADVLVEIDAGMRRTGESTWKSRTSRSSRPGPTRR